MARKATSRKPAVAPKPPLPPTDERPNATKPPHPSNGSIVAQPGLLQLTFARHAHGYGFLAAAAFLLNAILLLTLGGQPLPLPPGVQLDMVLWLLPAMAGALAAP